MASTIQAGPADDNRLPHKSLGILFYEALRKWDTNRTLIIDCTGEEINSGKIIELSVKLAGKFENLGVKKGDVITIIGQNQFRYLVTTIAGFYIGAKVNLLNHEYTAGELKHFLSICQPTVVFCSSKNVNNVLKLKHEIFFPQNVVIFDGEDSADVKSFDNFLKEVPNGDNFAPIELNIKEDVALILTSSGTTGLPKCVQLTHMNLRLSLTYATDPYFLGINEKQSLLGYLPPYHIFGTVLALTSLYTGAKYVLLDKFLPDRFLNIIQEHKITQLFVVPPILLFLVKSPMVRKYDISSITDVISGAALITKELEEMGEKLLNLNCIRQLYGMTEIAGAATCTPHNMKKYGSCGKVVTTIQIKVADIETGKVLPANQIGELRMKGDGVMKGYLGNPVESEDAFDEEGYVRSGDIGYYDEEGYFYIVDRLKEIIKYKGFQVSPAELENLLIQHPAVKDAGVVGKFDERAGEVPLAFIVKQPNHAITEEELVNYVAENISVQKHLQGGVRFIEEIPKSASGKILRRKLKELL